MESERSVPKTTLVTWFDIQDRNYQLDEETMLGFGGAAKIRAENAGLCVGEAVFESENENRKSGQSKRTNEFPTQFAFEISVLRVFWLHGSAVSH